PPPPPPHSPPLPIIVMPHLPQVRPGRGLFDIKICHEGWGLYHVFWYCVCNFYPLSTIGDIESRSCPRVSTLLINWCKPHPGPPWGTVGGA
ncbi:MAG: hypothetical protein MJE68_30870, partial [Proteobacteria bacterium]|nr:hypothetical protein [Pseudomonadota bacterium]